MDYKVVFHIDEMEKGKLLIGNVRNLLHSRAGSAGAVEILANSSAVEMCRRDNPLFRKDLEELSLEGVRICACRNSLKSLGLDEESLLPMVEIVPVGVGELVERQREGYAYIKP